MSSSGRTPSAKRGLLAGVALLVLSGTGLAHAAAAPAPGAHAAARAAPPADGLKPGEMYMEADLLIRDDKAKTTTARGGVEVRYDGRTLRAKELVYDEARGVITATGDVQIISADGSVEYGDHIVLDDKMQAGVIQGFSTRIPATSTTPPAKIAAASAVRRNENVNELNRAIYTPCDICAKDGSPKTPSWSIKAEKVVQDHVHQLVYYRNATVQILGAPVLYLPVFWHPDPQAVRKSGFLPPNFGASNRRGVSYEQPYVQVLTPSSDITLSPQINTRVNPFLNGRYRERFHSGALEARFGYTHDKDFDGKGNAFGDDTSRSYVLASGAFAIDQAWRWGFTAERTSDKLIFDKYDIGDVYVARGPYVADDRRLISQIYATRQDQKSWFSVAAFSIQGLRPGDNDRTFPVVAPLLEARWEPEGNVGGGRLRLLGSAVALTRDQSPDNQALNLPGLDSRRATAEADWRATFTSTGGVRVSPFVNARLDAYSLGDLNGTSGASKSVSRALINAGADITWPFAKRVKESTVILEPIVQLIASPKVQQVRVGTSSTGAPVYLNEDSVAFEFDETNLFRPDKFPGYDLYEDGLRANVGGRASVLWDDGRRASLLIGRSFRDTANGVFSTTSGLAQKSSDWIVAADAQPLPGLSLFTRARLDADDLTVERAEAGANISMKRGSGYFRYLRDRSNPSGVPVENVDLGGEIFLSQHWGVTAYGNRDLEQDAWVIRDLGLVYRDECTRIDIIYRREDVVVGRLGKTESIAIRLTLATLGGPMYAH
jgi:LPS-assembly protein